MGFRWRVDEDEDAIGRWEDEKEKESRRESSSS